MSAEAIGRHRGKPKDRISQFFSRKGEQVSGHIMGETVYILKVVRRDNNLVERSYRICISWDAFYRVDSSMHNLLTEDGENPSDWHVFSLNPDTFS